MTELVLEYRHWLITVTDHDATAISPDGERFECHRQASFEEALRAAKAKVERLVGPERWIEGYEDEALR